MTHVLRIAHLSCNLEVGKREGNCPNDPMINSREKFGFGTYKKNIDGGTDH